MILWALVSLCGLVTLAGVAGRRAARRSRPALPPAPRTLSTLRPGDVVAWEPAGTAGAGDAHCVVEVAQELVAAGPWRALYRLGDGAAGRGLLAAVPLAPGGDEAWVLDAVPVVGVAELPPHAASAPQVVHVNGERHRLVGRHRSAVHEARLDAAGVQTRPVERRVLLWLYRGPGAARLLALRWESGDGTPQPLELLRGQARPAIEIEILPGS